MNGHNLPPVIRRVLLAAILGSTTLFARADDLTGTPPSPPAVIGTELTANLVNLIFLFDRVAGNPPRATTKNYLARVSEPSSPLYPDYLEYQRGMIDRLELEKRLPHVAMLGDSLRKIFISLRWRAPSGVHERNGARIGFWIPIPIQRAFSASTNDSNTLHHSWQQNTTEPGH